MKVTIKTSQLQELADLVTRFVSKHSTLPILENIYIKGSNNTLLLRATDMEKYVNVEIKAQVDAEGALTVNAKTFTDIIKTLEDEYTTLSIDQSTDKLLIRTAGDLFTMRGIPAQEYVAIPEVRSDNYIGLDAKQLSTGIGKVEFAVTEKNFSPVLTGILMKTKKDVSANQTYLVFVGSDSFRLAEYKIPTHGESASFDIIIPKTTCSDVKRVVEFYLAQGGTDVEMKFAENLVSFIMKVGDIELTTTSLLIQGVFPDYDNESVIPTTGEIKIQVNKVDLEKAIKKISILTRDINNYVALRHQPDNLHITSGETDRGDAQSQIPAVSQGADMLFGLNGKYVSDYIRAIESPDLRMQVIDAEKPVVFHDPQDPAYKYIVRPLFK